MSDHTENRTSGHASHEDWRLIYQISVSDIAFFKNQQWAVTTYALLLLGSLTGIARLIPAGPTEKEQWALALGVLGVGAAGVYMVWRLHAAITEARDRLGRAYSHLASEVKTELEALPKRQGRQRADVTLLLTGVVVGAAFLSCWLLLCRLHAT